VDANLIDAFDATRDLSKKPFRAACYAPYSSMYFTTLGEVRVCCHNWKFSIGNVATDSLDDIWQGYKLRILREALREYDLGYGCDYCEWRIAGGNFASNAMTKWDYLPLSSSVPEWPSLMEFSIGNTCNLQCIMCNGNFSSAIRSHREKRPPMPRVYNDDFFDDLRKYLPHLKKARFLGGEPFLQQDCYRIWGMLVEDGISLPCHVTTNGTQFHSRMEPFLEALPFSIFISMDGFKKETIEKVRVNVRYEDLMENVARFRDYARRRNTHFGLTFCLMRPNWSELADFCLFGDELDCSVFVNIVRRPSKLSLYAMPLRGLKKIVKALEAQAVSVLPKLNRNRAVFSDEISRLQRRLRGDLEAPGLVTIKGNKVL
jgi:MoaA/NifB/PqqE/SkfB family radical SAM enzyme